MIYSMTGFGRKEAEFDQLRLVVEMRSVNHRFCEIVVRLPKTWLFLEDRVKKAVSQKIRRGRVEIFVSCEANASAGSGISINHEAVQGYLRAIKELAERYQLPDPFDTWTARDLLQLPGVILTGDEAVLSEEEAAARLLPLVDEAVDDLLTMRRSEGRMLHADLQQRLNRIRQWSEEIRTLAPQAVAEYRCRLQERLAEWSADFQIDEQRLAQEVLLFAERADIAEEATRLASHCQQFAQLLDGDEAVGRKLDFLLQEMHRETNTIAAKANYLPIQRIAVEVKTELEKMREQVQNVE